MKENILNSDILFLKNALNQSYFGLKSVSIGYTSIFFSFTSVFTSLCKIVPVYFVNLTNQLKLALLYV